MESKPHARLGCPKTTTGCRTCKWRKLRCDEARPGCLRCKKAGHHCAGYGVGAAFIRKTSQEDLVGWNISVDSNTNLMESHYFTYFVNVVSPTLAGLLDAHFWTTQLPQISQRESSVRYGVLALSASLSSQGGGRNGNATSTEALRYYNRAIQATIDRIQATRSTLLALISCILFFCLESLTGHDSNALLMCRQAQSIIDQPFMLQHDPVFYSPDSAVGIQRMVSRLRVMAAVYGNLDLITSSSSVLSTPLSTKRQFADICESRMVLFDITAEIHSFIWRSSVEPQSGDDVERIHKEKAELFTKLDGWLNKSSFLLPFGDKIDCKSPAQQYREIAALILRSHYLLNLVFLFCAFSETETSYDGHIQSFLEIVRNAEIILTLVSQSRPRSPLLFQLEMGLLYPLYFSACKCRCPKLRRHALKLLRYAPTQEGLWTAKRMSRVAQRVVEFEEDSCRSDGGLGSKRIHTAVQDIRNPTKMLEEEFYVTFSSRTEPSGELEVWSEWLAL